MACSIWQARGETDGGRAVGDAVAEELVRDGTPSAPPDKHASPPRSRSEHAWLEDDTSRGQARLPCQARQARPDGPHPVAPVEVLPRGPNMAQTPLPPTHALSPLPPPPLPPPRSDATWAHADDGEGSPSAPVCTLPARLGTGRQIRDGVSY
eukprot:7067040-Prymnesium_polylepis.1